MFAVLALLASLIYGAADFLGGMAGRRMPVFTVVLWSQAVGLVLAVVAALGFPASQQRQLTGLGWGAIAGLLGTAGLVALYRGLAMGRMSIVSPIAALLSGLLPLGIGLGIGERPSPVQWIGIALAFPAIWLVASASTADVGRRRGGIGYGIVAGFGFGFFFAAIAQAGDGAGFWPLVGARMASVASVGIIAAIRRFPLPPPGSRLLIFTVGAGDILANVFLLLALRTGLLTLVAVLASLYPAITVLLAVWVLSEAVGRRQQAGLVLALGAVALLAV